MIIKRGKYAFFDLLNILILLNHAHYAGTIDAVILSNYNDLSQFNLQIKELI